jgi:anaerobic selenocysteine-containing dehydrogenase
MATEHPRTCPFCEATCGILLSVEGGRVKGVRGDRDDPFSQGYICAKAAALPQIHSDPDRVRQPLRRSANGWEPVSWSTALSEAVAALAAIQRRHGRDAVALYRGNPVLHSYSASLAGISLAKALRTRNLYSTASVDHQPHLLAALQMFGNRALLLVPDIDRTDFLMLLGTNPLVSNGSMMTAPNMPARLARLRARGGRLVVVDPQRTLTAEAADVYLAIRPGTDAALLLAMLHTFFQKRLIRTDGVADLVQGLDSVREAVVPFSPERVAPFVGVPADEIRMLAVSFAAARRAVCHGRLGVSTQRFGGLCAWLVLLVNALTGRFDAEGGAMLPTPAVDLAALARWLGEEGGYRRWHSRVSEAPEVNGELPLAALAEEIEQPGPGQVRGLITVAGNPVLSAPQGERLERALLDLDYMVAIDLYINESSRLAHVILPASFALERDHFDLLMYALAVRNVARYSPPLFASDDRARADWRILLDLAVGIGRARGGVFCRPVLEAALLRRITPRRLLALLIRFGPHGAGLLPTRRGLSLSRLEREGRTVDLGPMRPGRLRAALRGRPIWLAPVPMLEDLSRLARCAFESPPPGDLVLVGRRLHRRHNSWLANSPALAKGLDPCRLYVHPADARRRGIIDGQIVTVRSHAGKIEVPVTITERIREGVVSLPHGFGHGRPGARIGIAATRPGASVNALTDAAWIDQLSGTSILNGFPVAVEPAKRSAEAGPAISLSALATAG